ncbi:MAG TPA: GAF domain-containing protein [Terriglobales bacterium]|nr:GAF domain-containing protein [Terriglobales bacterium]
MSLNLASELERLASALTTDSDATGQFSIPSLAERIAKYLNVKTEEIAIMGVSERWRHLYFIVPEALKHVGHIPLSSPVAIAARTVRESRPEIDNNFRETRHVTVFESIKTETLSSATIQKIISAPILAGEKVLGVIQVSRKGDNPAEAGPDFGSDDLGKVLALCKPLGKLLQHFIRD